MKKILIVMLLMALLLCGCAPAWTDITREEIVAAYEVAGYSVSSRVYDEKLEYGQVGYIQADHPDGNYIYFVIFESGADAKAYKEEYYHPVVIGLFSAIYGDPSWPRWEVYGSIIVQYDEPDFLEPFTELLEGE